MFIASCSSCLPNTLQLITQVSISSELVKLECGSRIITLTRPLSPNRSTSRNCQSQHPVRQRSSAIVITSAVIVGGGEVELICLADELCDTRQVDLVDGPKVTDMSSDLRKSSRLSMDASIIASAEAFAGYCSPAARSSQPSETDLEVVALFEAVTYRADRRAVRGQLPREGLHESRSLGGVVIDKDQRLMPMLSCRRSP